MTAGRARLRAWIERSKVKDYEAAALLTVHPVMLSQWLSGTRTPGLDSAVKIEQITGIPVGSWLQTAVPSSADDDAAPVRNRRFSKR